MAWKKRISSPLIAPVQRKITHLQMLILGSETVFQAPLPRLLLEKYMILRQFLQEKDRKQIFFLIL